MAVQPDADMLPAALVTLGLVGAAFLKPLMRVITFIAVAALFAFPYWYIINWNLVIQISLYMTGRAWGSALVNPSVCPAISRKCFANIVDCCSSINLRLARTAMLPVHL